VRIYPILSNLQPFSPHLHFLRPLLIYHSLTLGINNHPLVEFLSAVVAMNTRRGRRREVVRSLIIIMKSNALTYFTRRHSLNHSISIGIYLTHETFAELGCERFTWEVLGEQIQLSNVNSTISVAVYVVKDVLNLPA
jgi:hypothetical protein